MRIKQEVFKNIKGHKVIFTILKQGLALLNTYEEIFIKMKVEGSKSKRLHVSQEYNSFKLIMSIFKNCHKILRIFCKNNNKNQEFLIFKKINLIFFFKRILCKKIDSIFSIHLKFNIGQVDILIDIFRENFSLANKISKNQLFYFANLIKIHGKHPKFLEIFILLLNSSEKSQNKTNSLQKKILEILLDNNNRDYLNVNFFKFKFKFK